MKKLLVFLAASSLLLSAACLTEKPMPDNVLEKSAEAMEKVDSYSFDVRSSAVFRTESSIKGSSMSEMELLWRGRVDRVNQRMFSELTMVMDSANASVEQYVVDGVEYTKVPVFGWVRNQTPEGFWAVRDYASMRPNLSTAEATLLPDESIGGIGCYVVEVNVSAEEFLGLLSRHVDSRTKPSAEEISALRSHSLREWVDKETFLVKRRRMEMRLLDDRYDASFNTTVDFSSYGDSVEIELPKEAKYALDMDAVAAGII